MKFLALLLTYLIAFQAMAAAPLGVVGQNDTAKLYPPVVKVPNSQATSITGGALLETGNKNRLKNPGFEASASSAALWDIAQTGTATIGLSTETVAPIEGKQSLIFSCAGGASGGTCTVSQDVVTKYAMDGIVSASLQSNTASGVKLWKRIGAVNTYSESIESTAALPFKIDGAFGTVSTGIAVEITVPASTTYQVIMDDAKVAYEDLKQDISPVGPWTAYTPVLSSSTGVNLNTAHYRQVGDSLQVRGSLGWNAAGAGSTFTVAIPSGFTINTSKLSSVAGLAIRLGSARWFDSGTSTYPSNIEYNDTSSIYFRLDSPTGIIPSGTTFASGDFLPYEFTVPVNQLNSQASIYSSTNYDSDKIGEIIWLPTATTPAGFVPLNIKSIGKSGANYNGSEYYKLYELLWALPGTVTTAGHPFRISSAKGATALADWDALKTITLDFETNGVFIRQKKTASSLGAYEASDNLAHTHGLPLGPNAANGFYGLNTTYNQTFTTYSTNPPTQTSGNASEARPNNVSLYGYIRFSPRRELITANLSGLESCTDSYECTDTFTARITTAGVISDENLEWITGNCVMNGSLNSTANCTLKTGLFASAPNCTWQSRSGGASRFDAATSTTTTITASGWTVAGTSTAIDGFISCSRGADYIGKTAKAVASDQNVRSIGSVGVDIQSVYFGSGANCASYCTASPCTICRQVGTKITSVSRTGTGTYTINGIDGTKYICTGTGRSVNGGVVMDQILGSSNSSYAYVVTWFGGGANDVSDFSVQCVGIP